MVRSLAASDNKCPSLFVINYDVRYIVLQRTQVSEAFVIISQWPIYYFRSHWNWQINSNNNNNNNITCRYYNNITIVVCLQAHSLRALTGCI
jgi:hypothetical protein